MPSAPRCSILFALPIDRSQFDAVARGDRLTDYGVHLLRGEDANAVWDRRYARVAAAATQLRHEALAFGAQLFPMATLRDLTHASASSDAVVLLAHWRGWLVSPHDFRADASAVIDRLGRVGLGDVLRRSTRRRPDVADIAADLNLALEQSTLLERCAPDLALGVPDSRLRTALGRDLIDERLGPLIVPGNRVELYDGRYTPGEIERALSIDFSGDLDLSTCSSFALATVISMRRGTRLSLVHTTDVIEPIACCIQITAALRYLAAHGGRYASARLAVQEQLEGIRPCFEAEAT